MTCPNCSKEIADDSNFCEFCGTEIPKHELMSKKKKKIIWSFLATIIGIVVLSAPYWVYRYVEDENAYLNIDNIPKRMKYSYLENCFILTVPAKGGNYEWTITSNRPWGYYRDFWSNYSRGANPAEGISISCKVNGRMQVHIGPNPNSTQRETTIGCYTQRYLFFNRELKIIIRQEKKDK